MKAVTVAAAAALVLALPGAAFAATYAYVNTTGSVQTIEAATPNAALAASNIAPRSGVILITNEDGSLTGDSSENTNNTDTDDTKAADDLRAGLRMLLGEHVELSVDVLQAINDEEENSSETNRRALTTALDEQDTNAEELSAAIGSVYGDTARDAFEDLFKKHIEASNDYTRALVVEDEDGADEAYAELKDYLNQISTFLAGANPNIDRATLLAALTAHEDLLNDSSEAYIAGDEDKADDLEDEAITQIMGGADYLADAIIKQYPDKF